eukprot:1832523-Prymnesium_polylepis.2
MLLTKWLVHEANFSALLPLHARMSASGTLEPLRKGSDAWYTAADGTRSRVTIKCVHYDDEPSYYTVTIDGVERETVRERLEPAEPVQTLAQHLSVAQLWYYVDDAGNQQGPFGADALEAWISAGYFKPSTLVAPSLYGEIPQEHWPAVELFGDVMPMQAVSAAAHADEPPMQA